MAFALCGMNLFGDNQSHVFFGALTLVGALFVLPNGRKTLCMHLCNKNFIKKWRKDYEEIFGTSYPCCNPNCNGEL